MKEREVVGAAASLLGYIRSGRGPTAIRMREREKNNDCLGFASSAAVREAKKPKIVEKRTVKMELLRSTVFMALFFVFSDVFDLN